MRYTFELELFQSDFSLIIVTGLLSIFSRSVFTWSATTTAIAVPQTHVSITSASILVPSPTFAGKGQTVLP